MNKRGFTLIEIIICISIIAIIGTGSIIALNIVNKNKTISNLNNKILEAASVFANIEKDNNGDVYANAVQSYAKGVKIPLQTLVEKGYIENNLVEQIYESNNYTDYKNKDYYVLLANQQDYCEVGTSYILSWTMSENTPIYLCDKNIPGEVTLTAKNIINNTNLFKNNNINLFKTAVSESYCNTYDCTTNNIVGNENGLYFYNGKEINYPIDGNDNLTYYPNIDINYYYYRGAVEDNYVTYGKDENGNDVIWRILWLNDKGVMKLVLNDTIPITVKGKYGETIKLKAGDKIYKIDEYVSNTYISDNNIFIADLLNPVIIDFDKYIYVKKENILKQEHFPRLNYNYSNYINFYTNIELAWFDTLTEKDESILITEDNFCYSSLIVNRGSSNTNFYIEPASFICWTGSADNYSNDDMNRDSPKFYSTNYSSKIGLLNVGEVRRAGIGTANIDENDLNLATNFLMADKSYILSDIEEKNTSSDTYHNYLVDKTFLKYSQSNENTTTYSLANNYKFLYENDSQPFLFINSTTGSYEASVRTWSKEVFNIIADSLKPTITVDYEKINLTGDGTKNNPYVMVKK